MYYMGKCLINHENKVKKLPLEGSFFIIYKIVIQNND